MTDRDLEILTALQDELDRLNGLGRNARMTGDETTARTFFTEKTGVNNAMNIVWHMMLAKDKN